MWILALGEAAQGASEVRWVDPEVADFAPAPAHPHLALVPVLVGPDAEAAKRQRCPSCGQDDGIRFLGSRLATLAFATLGQIFGSANVEAEKRRPWCSPTAFRTRRTGRSSTRGPTR